MKKGKEFIFPENVDKDYGIWKDYKTNIYKSIKQMRVIIEYCEENKINVCENFKSKYLSLVEKPL